VGIALRRARNDPMSSHKFPGGVVRDKVASPVPSVVYEEVHGLPRAQFRVGPDAVKPLVFPIGLDQLRQVPKFRMIRQQDPKLANVGGGQIPPESISGEAGYPVGEAPATLGKPRT